MCTVIHRLALPLLAGLSSSMLAIDPASAQALPAARIRPVDRYAAPIAEASRRFVVPTAWIRVVIRAESAGDPHAVSRTGAIGLMQIMPGTWADLRIRYRLGVDPFDPRDNIMAGAGYLRELYGRYGSPGFLAAYNAGPGRYEAYLGGRPLPAATVAYVATLAPRIGIGGDVRPIVVASIGPSAWLQSPLFVAQSRRAPGANPVWSDSASTATPVRDVTAIAPRPGALFVGRLITRTPR